MATIRTAVFVVPGETIDTPGTDGLIGHKFDSIYNELKKNGWDVKVLTDVYTKASPTGSRYSTSSLKARFLVEVVFALVKNTIEVIRSPNPLRFINQLALRKTYTNAISLNQPTIIFSIGASEALVWACRESKIPCAEIQHGMFERSDLQIYWPGGLYPDFFLTWDSRSGRIAKDLGVKPWVVGHPDFRDSMTRAWRPDLGQFVCVSLGYNASGSEDPWGCFPKSLVRAVDLLIESKIPVLIRLHPVLAARIRKSRALKKWISNRFGNLRIDSPDKVPLSDSIRDSFCNLTMLSATWFDFALAGRGTAVLDAQAAERYDAYSKEITVWASGKSPIFSPRTESDLLQHLQKFEGNLETAKNIEIESLEEHLEMLDSI
jgi:hypothetical protein